MNGIEVVLGLARGREVTDREWDRMYPRWARGPSRVHWTPVEVARRAAELLVTQPGVRVLDVGSGVGKFCMVGALTSAGVFTGIEQRGHLVQLARDLVDAGQVPRCTFIHGDLQRIDWRRFQAFYLFNPFAEQLPGSRMVDDAIAAEPKRYRALVRFVEEALAERPPGTRVVTFHGFGGQMPRGWRRALAEDIASGPLELWVKGSGAPGEKLSGQTSGVP